MSIKLATAIALMLATCTTALGTTAADTKLWKCWLTDDSVTPIAQYILAFRAPNNPSRADDEGEKFAAWIRKTYMSDGHTPIDYDGSPAVPKCSLPENEVSEHANMTADEYIADRKEAYSTLSSRTYFFTLKGKGSYLGGE